MNIDYCDVYDNESDEVRIGSSSLTVDPDFTSFSSSTAPDTWDLTLSASSDLIDAGDPAIYDTDKTTSDIGAYGGPNGDW